MKPTFTFVIFLAIALCRHSCHGQSLFFTDLNTSTWVSSAGINDLPLKTSEDIPLSKLILSKDSLTKNVSIWTFRDSTLTIQKYHASQKTETLIGIYKFESFPEKGLLKVTLSNGQPLLYKVGILSSGHYALLINERKKKHTR